MSFFDEDDVFLDFLTETYDSAQDVLDDFFSYADDLLDDLAGELEDLYSLLDDYL